MKFEIEQGAAIHLGSQFDSAGGFRMGKDSVVNENCRLDTRGGISIGDYVAIAAQTVILTADHDPKTPNFNGRSRQVVIEDYAFIGTRAMILPGVTICRGAIVAAGGVVTRSVKNFDIVGGVPARSIGTRTDKLSYSTKYLRLLH